MLLNDAGISKISVETAMRECGSLTESGGHLLVFGKELRALVAQQTLQIAVDQSELSLSGINLVAELQIHSRRVLVRWARRWRQGRCQFATTVAKLPNAPTDQAVVDHGHKHHAHRDAKHYLHGSP